MQWISCVSVFLLGMLLTGLVRKLAWRYGFVDQPGARRTHLQTTPRGGGMAVAIAFFAWLTYAFWAQGLSSQIWSPLMPAVIVSLLGFWDDISPLSAKFRLFMQFICAYLSLIFMNGIGVQLTIWGYVIPNIILFIVALFFLVWSINLYNFMDGVNGLAGVEALCVSVFMSILTWIDGQVYWSSMWAVLASAVASFLWWNFPKAKIFLGDVGSYFLGFVFGVLLIQSAHIKPRWFWCGMILLGYFVVDATFTLLIRIWYKQPIFKAHHTHAFQIFHRYFQGNHVKVTTTVLAINLFWLMPWAYITSKDYMPGFCAMLISYLPLVIIAAFVKAGRPQNH